MKNFTRGLTKVGVSALLMGLAGVASAQGLNNVTGNIMNQMPGITDVFGAASYVLAIGLFIKAGLKLKEHTESKGQVPLSHPMTYAIVAAILFALPSFMTTGKEAVFGGGAQTTGVTGGTLRSVR